MKKHYSVIVVGAGSMGMAAGYYLGKKGIDTLLIDSYDPPHGMASHHGETRLIRHAPAEGEQYVPLILRAQELWDELERETNNKLFYPTGTLLVGEEDAPFIKETVNIANKFSLPLEKLTPYEIEQRWQQFSIPEKYTGFFEPDSGVLLNQNIILAYRRLAESYQVNIQSNTKVTSIEPSNGGVTVVTNQNKYYADKLAICAGAWTGKILRDLELPLQTVRKTFGWFATNDISFQPPMLPCFYFNCDNQRYYGFPDITGSGVKVGRNDSERDIDPDIMKEDFKKHPKDKEDLIRFARKFLPNAANKFKDGRACMITKAPNKNFILDSHPDYNNIFIAAGFSGHGFKYSSAIGEVISQQLSEKKPGLDISSFSISSCFANAGHNN